MAVRRMFSVSVMTSDGFMSLPAGVQVLYLYLNLYADDDGLVDNPMVIVRLARKTKADLDRLKEAGFIIPLGSGVVAIRHWRLHNRVRKDRYTPTRYQKELAKLWTTPDGRYELSLLSPANHGNQRSTAG